MTNHERAQFNARLFTAAKEQGKLLTDLPEAMGFSRSTWYKKRKGTVDWTLSEMLRLAKILRVNVVWLFPVLGEVRA